MLDVFSELKGQLTCASVFAGKRETYDHTFGGGTYTGAIHPKCPHPWHLLYRLDLNDRAIGITMPNCRYLPLFSAFRYGSSIQYRPTSDTEIHVIFQDRLEYTPKYPRPDLPATLPEYPASVSRESLETVVYDEGMQEHWCDFNTGEPLETPPTRNEMCALTAGVNQMQIVDCTKCMSCGTTMDFLAAATGEPEEDTIKIWDSEWDNEYVAMLFMLCPECHAIDSSILAN